jgi:hypothetical protein
VWLFVLIPLLLLISPWQQNIRASGKVIAFAPVQRQQKIESPVAGRITQWFVREGASHKNFLIDVRKRPSQRESLNT